MSKRVRSSLILPAVCGLGLAAVLLSSCSSKAPQQPARQAGISGPGDYSRPHRDGAPWWDVDVSRIPDAVPMPHNGSVKANPYTVLGKTYYPMNDARAYRMVGTASWYGTKFHGQATANGETYDLYGMTAAHKTLPLPSYVRVTNLDNGKSVIVRVNDRGPFYSDRVIDLSFAAAKKLGYAETGTARVKVEGIDPVQWWAQRGRPAPMVLAQPSRRWPRPLPPRRRRRRWRWPSRSRPTLRRRRSTRPPCCRCRSTQKKRFITSRWPVSPGGRLRQPGCGGAAEGQAERRDGCAGVYQLGRAQPADSAPGAAGTDRFGGRG